MKTNKSFSKRLKLTKNGKLMMRKAGQNHFNAKEGGRNQIARGRSSVLVMNNKDRSRFFATS